MSKEFSKNGEQISALMDGEFEQASKQCKDALDAITGCEQSQSEWERFHLVRALLLEKQEPLADFDLSLRVSQALQNEPHRIGSTGWFKKVPSESKLWKQMVGIGIAASVTAIMITGIQTTEPLLPEATMQNQFTNQFAPVLQNVVPATARLELPPAAPSLTEQQRLQRLFLQHTLSTAENSLKGLLPYAKVVSYGRIPTQVVNVNAVPTSASAQKQQDIEARQKP